MGILEGIRDYIKNGETDSEKFGLEIEHFVLDKDELSMDFDTISGLIEKVANEINAEIIYMDNLVVGYVAEDYSVTLEPSCQFEISINPHSKLTHILKTYNEFLDVWEPEFERLGYILVTKGNHPLVELGELNPCDIPLSPKKRYKYMDSYLRESGNYGVYMMRASASAQVSIDFKSEKDMVKKLRVLQKISPILMMMMENKTDDSSVLNGPNGKKHLFRIQEWDDLDPARTGFFPHSFDDDFGYDKIAEVVYNTPLILLSDNGKTEYVGSKSIKDIIEEGTIDENNMDKERRKKLIEHVFSMGFFHYRIKNYIEIRIADSVPIERALEFTALIKGIVYSDRNLNIIDDELSDIDSISKIQDAVEKIKDDGFDAVIYHGKTVSEWESFIVKLAKKNLTEFEKEYLCNVRAIWSECRKENPA